MSSDPRDDEDEIEDGSDTEDLDEDSSDDSEVEDPTDWVKTMSMTMKKVMNNSDIENAGCSCGCALLMFSVFAAMSLVVIGFGIHWYQIIVR